MKQRILDKNGNPVVVVHSTIPGLLIMPKEDEVIETISAEEYDDHIKAVDEQVKKYKPRNLAKELDDLKAENELLKGKLDEVKANVDKIKKP